MKKLGNHSCCVTSLIGFDQHDRDHIHIFMHSQSPLAENTWDAVVRNDFLHRLDRWYNGEGLIQQLLDDLNASQREMLLTALSDEELANLSEEDSEDQDRP